jgi:hypothetical protein
MRKRRNCRRVAEDSAKTGHIGPLRAELLRTILGWLPSIAEFIIGFFYTHSMVGAGLYFAVTESSLIARLVFAGLAVFGVGLVCSFWLDHIRAWTRAGLFGLQDREWALRLIGAETPEMFFKKIHAVTGDPSAVEEREGAMTRGQRVLLWLVATFGLAFGLWLLLCGPMTLYERAYINPALVALSLIVLVGGVVAAYLAMRR